MKTSYRWGVKNARVDRILPAFMTRAIVEAMPLFNRKMHGYVTAEANVIGVETKTSSPVRILRDENFESVSHKGLFPVGEGAGYAGGIMSSALDGVNVGRYIVLVGG